MNVLQRWLNATKIDELRARNSLLVLRQFVQRAFIVNYMDRDTERTKILDKITQNIAVPSRNVISEDIIYHYLILNCIIFTLINFIALISA